MDQNINTGAPMPAEKNSMSSVISILVIVLVLAIGAYYFMRQVPAPTEPGTLSPAEAQADPSISSLSTQGTSTNIDDIEADLNATDFSGIDEGFSDITI